MAKKKSVTPTQAEQEEGLVCEIMSAADRHGEQSEPEHEVGDLQDAIRLMWGKLTYEQKRAVHNDYFQMHGHWDGREDDDK